jgi:hypothetical protein
MSVPRRSRPAVSAIVAQAIAVLALAVTVGACQPLPHPFADDRPPASLLRVRDSAGISIAPIEGGPPAAASKLGAAVASALVKHDIPASDRTTNLTSYLLYGRLEAQRPRAGQETVAAHWQLQDAAGHLVGERITRLEAPAKTWETGADAVIAQLAEASAAEIAPLLADEPPPGAAAAAGQSEAASKAETTAGKAEATAGKAGKAEIAVAKTEQAGRTRVAIRPVSGAPGDGAKSLANAIATILKRQDLTVIDDANAKADVILDGQVTIAPVKPDKQHVKIVWHVRRADGAEIGTVGQENDVPKGMLDGPWGDVAYSVAIAGADGLMQVIARAGPERKS